MNSFPQALNLTNYIVEPVRKNLNKKLELYRYYDVCKEDELTTNNKGVDIISHQLELKFEDNKSIYISWATIDGWFQYSLCVSETSFCNGAEIFTKQDDNWAEIVGKRLKSFEVYGYKENTIISTETTTGKAVKKTYEPHLLILYFDGDRSLGIANFYLEKDFHPKYSVGDDIWIIFGRSYIDSCIENLALENLDIWTLANS